MMEKFFSPKSVAVIGASRDPKKVGHVVFRNFLESGFKGRVYAVNPNAEVVMGYKAYASVAQLPNHAELAVVCVPAPIVPKVVDECGRADIKNVIVISGGFKEVGNVDLEKRLKEVVKKHKIRLIGPNCLGVYDPYTGIDTFFLPRHRLGRPKEGKIAFISQSGAVASVVLDWMDSKGYRASKFISYGNAADIDEADLIEYLDKDPKTSVICAYLEGVADGQRFMEAARRTKKPLIVLKGGVTEQGSHAVASHTGSLAGSAQVYSAVFKQTGTIEAADLEQIFDFARTLAYLPLPKGNRVQIVTDGGGFGILTVDEIVKRGLQLASLDKTAVRTLAKQMPSHVVLKNPMDLTGDADAARYSQALEIVMADKNVDMVALIILLQTPNLGDEIVEVVKEFAERKTKPVFVISAGGNYTEVLKRTLDDIGIPTFSYPDGAVAAMKALHDYAVSLGEKNKSL